MTTYEPIDIEKWIKTKETYPYSGKLTIDGNPSIKIVDKVQAECISQNGGFLPLQ